MKTVALIPCKSKSERLPAKNLKRVGDKTLVERAVYVANKCDLVVLCSDSTEIIDLGLAMAETVGVRGVGLVLDEEMAELTGKRVPMEDVIEAAIRRYPGDRYVLLQPTSPLRRRRHVQSALALLDEVDSAHSVHEVTEEVYFSGTTDASGCWTPDRPWGTREFSNDLQKRLRENGAIYAFTHDHWTKTRNRMSRNNRTVEMLPEEGIDINTPADLERAQRWWGGEIT